MRYLPLTPEDRRQMLARVGVSSIDDLFEDVPAAARLDGLVDLPLHQGELAVERELGALAARNVAAGSVPSFLGAGAYRHHVPATVDHLIQRSEFLTAYTPYQPEVSQGTLQMLFEFQTQVALITGMEVANASMYDGATACAEAALMACRLTRREKVVLSGGLHPHYRDVTKTSVKFGSVHLDIAEPDPDGAEDLAARIDGETACVIVQNPSFFGRLKDLRALADACHAAGALLVVVVTEVVSLGLVASPGEMGADIVVAEGQSLGVPLGFGGPYVGLFACRQKHVRQMPGRLCGETVDQDGRRGYVLTLSTREQHIRREKATSNICTNAGLCALAFSIHMTLLGEAGLTELASLNHRTAVALADRLARVPGVEVMADAFFNEFTLRLAKPAAQVVETLAGKGILAGVPVSRLYANRPALENLLLVAATECNTEADGDRLASALEEALR
ncbi:aminomethyl-transferring glycine dehydrogenase subunit GcvPA [Oceanibacterium hippocampi]|uniref:Probable glycine dehydrogenase (decarboxylating) subunit 1 n=1 Tax=Oceanibacterium hippocampi TaxID=745714 RepID=A0A1Y5S6P5_9PROT|nr:aminomethyl-transferring glycine dehydrogenase subunit GcvPA [Oceanibacterium hippocampi]SLN33757.1 putative glycine dehydrogenase (decarboxylating) subunit 1 [Oceanibacterium hippocampi]